MNTTYYPALVLLLLVGCTTDKDDTGQDGEPTDTGASPVDSGTGDSGAQETGSGDSGSADSGASETGTGGSGVGDSASGDSGADTSTKDSGTDTGTVDSGDLKCTVDDVEWLLEVRDSSGTASTSFGSDDVLTFAAVVNNPCDEDFSFETRSTCLVTSWSLERDGGIGEAMAIACGDAITTWDLPALDQITTTEVWGRVSAGNWTAGVSFNFRGFSAEQAFTVK